MFLVAGGIAMAMAGAAPTSAAVIQTGALLANMNSAESHYCTVTNTGSNPLGSGSKAELVDDTGTVTVSADLSGQGAGSMGAVYDPSFHGAFEYCRVTVPGSTKNVRAILNVFFWDGTKIQTFATDDAR
jgi:hypothetical protein